MNSPLDQRHISRKKPINLSHLWIHISNFSLQSQNSSFMKYLRILTLYALIFAPFGCDRISSEDTVDFIILQMNDVYEIAPLEGGKVGGMARVATLRKSLLQETPNVITTLSGDFLSPSLIGTLKFENEKIAGRQMVDVMNAVGVDYVVPGNHEFDIKEGELLKRISESRFQWTSTNVFHKVDDEVASWQQNGVSFPDHIIHSIDGVDIAFFGSTVPFNKKNYVSYSDKYASVKSTYERIKDEAEIFIGLTHLGEEMDDSLATYFVPQLDLILGGHDHTNMIHKYGSTIMTKADANAKTVYVHRINFNKSSEKTTINSELVILNENVSEDAQVKAIVDTWVNISDESMSAMGYKPEAMVLITKDTLDGRESRIRNRPTNYPMMTAASFLYVVPQADLAILNSGSIRLDDQLTGTVTEYDILRSFPFGGGIALVDLKGGIIQKILNIGTVQNVGAGGYLQLANAEKKSDGWYIKGSKLSLDSTYKLALPDFVMGGGEANLGFLVDYKNQAANPTDFNGIRNDVRDIIIAYFKNMP